MSEPTEVSSQIAARLENMRQSMPPAADGSWEEEERRRTLAEIPRRLKEAGYPVRAVETLDVMRGPGLECAKSIQLGRGGLLFIIGERGPGKTQIATWLAAQRITDGLSCGTYRKALDLWGEIRSTWRQDSDESEFEAVARYSKKSFLVIDECQERGDTDADRQWCDRMLTHLIDRRYDSMLPTLLIANLSLGQYERTVPLSVRSRIAETGGVKVCDWPSYRH